MVGRWLRHEAAGSCQELLPLIVDPLSANLGIGRCARIRHFLMLVSDVSRSEVSLRVHHLEFSLWSILLRLHAHIEVVASHGILLRAGGVLLVHGLKPILEHFKIAKLVEISNVLIGHLWHVIFLVRSSRIHSLLAEVIGLIAVGHVFEVQATLHLDFWVVCMKVVWVPILTGNNDFLLIFVVNICVDLIWA